MANNLLISYDLHEPGKSYDRVIDKIKTLGGWAKIHFSYWYVDSTLTAAQAASAVWSVMDANDSVFVVDATNNVAAWNNVNPDVEKYIKAQWNR